jgi:hypothetical protein
MERKWLIVAAAVLAAVILIVVVYMASATRQASGAVTQTAAVVAQEIPEPASLWLLGSGLICAGVIGLRCRTV